MTDFLLVGLTRLNVVLASASVLMGFSLMAYLFVYNFRNRVARAFVLVLAFVTCSFVGDLFLATARLPAQHPAARFWLTFGWVGICFVAPAYLHFADALLVRVAAPSPRRRLAVVAGFALGAVALALTVSGGWLVGPVVGPVGAVRFSAGPLFGLFAAGYLALTAWGAHGVWQARARALTGNTRRRMSYLLVSVVAPLSVFPWLMAGGGALAGSALAFRSLAALGNLATASMLAVMAYGVAYHGALTPDRAVKRDLIKFLIQAPALGVFIIGLVLVVPERLETSLGLPRDVVVALAIVVGVVSYQFLVRLMKPALDLLVYGGEGRDVMWLRRLDERLLSEHDLAQLLESILTALCDQLRVQTSCVVLLDGGVPRIEAHTGDEARALDLLASLGPDSLARLAETRRVLTADGFWLRGLRTPDGTALLGLVAIERPAQALTPAERASMAQLLGSAEEALQDRVMQRRVVDALRALEPEIAEMQRLRGALRTGARPDLAAADGPAADPDFPHWVRDALVHYWGGPKLTASPLLDLGIVREALAASDFNTARAMRTVIDQALERLRPEGQRSFTASDWLLYNILELRFVKGLKVRDIARRLAMSESDLYRKQRVAIDVLAQQLAAMEGGEPPPDREASDEVQPAESAQRVTPGR
jgi:hypothetical protein